MRKFLLTSLIAVAAAAVFAFTIPAEATASDWELPPAALQTTPAAATR